MKVTWQNLVAGGAGDDARIVVDATEMGVDGLDLTEYRTTLIDRQTDGASLGPQWLNPAAPMMRVAIASDANWMRWRKAMKRRQTEAPWAFEGFGFPPGAYRMWCRPDFIESTAAGLVTKGFRYADLGWTSADGTVYSDASTQYDDGDATATSHTFPIVNAGDETGTTGRALRFTLNAAGGNVVSPYIEDNTGHRTTWQGLTLLAGQTLTLREDRLSFVGARWVDGYIRGSCPAGIVASEAANWPLLPPGTTPIKFGSANSGPITVRAHHRSTW